MFIRLRDSSELLHEDHREFLFLVRHDWQDDGFQEYGNKAAARRPKSAVVPSMDLDLPKTDHAIGSGRLQFHWYVASVSCFI